MATFTPHVYTPEQLEVQAQLIIKTFTPIEKVNILQDFEIERSYDAVKKTDKFFLRVELFKEINRDTALSILMGEEQ